MIDTMWDVSRGNKLGEISFEALDFYAGRTVKINDDKVIELTEEELEELTGGQEDEVYYEEDVEE